MWGRGLRGNNGACSALCWISVTSAATHNQIVPFWCWFLDVGFVYVLGPCGSLQQNLLWDWEFLLLVPQLPQVFSISGLRLYFPLTGAMDCVVCCQVHQLLPCPPRSTICHLAGSTSLHLAHPGPPATALPQVLSTQLPISTPPTGLDEWFFFNSLVFGLLYSSIFCQFCFFFF